MNTSTLSAIMAAMNLYLAEEGRTEATTVQTGYVVSPETRANDMAELSAAVAAAVAAVLSSIGGSSSRRL